MHEQSTVLARAAGVIANSPGLWSRLLTDHVAGHDGRCRACLSQVRLAPLWPCRIAVLASTARAAHERDKITNLGA
ncbi:hypothetical protein GCM10009609_53170 [Pseudonocardia aurantiaca]|uniref:Uncharacterized protein n=1 Tax=Pseudonocardia aurantiaca TaxID=75290 RepID=A0ABW4FMR7_9PSEU